MRIKAVILMFAILLQPFNAIAAAGTMAMLNDAPLSADSEHCESHADIANPAESSEAAADPAAPLDQQCIDECQICASAAGAFLIPAVVAAGYIADKRCAVMAGELHASPFAELLYRPPIRS